MSGTALADIAQIAASWEAACRAGDAPRIAAHLSHDARIWYNFAPAVEHDPDSYRAILEDSARRFRNVRYSDMRVHLHEGGFVEQATLTGETDKGPVEVPFLLVATVKDSKITRVEEYFDGTIIKSLDGA